MAGYKLIKFAVKGDSKGSLVALTGKSEIPFNIKRVFYIFGSAKNVIRGQHANRKTQHVLVPVAGSCEVEVDNGKKRESFCLSSPNQGLYINKMIWKEMKNFSKDCVLVVLADTKYDPKEYICDYGNYKTILNEKRNSSH